MAWADLLDSTAVERAMQMLHDPDTRVVGWGTGSVFDYFQGRSPTRLQFLVDNDMLRWGQVRRGIPICPPDRLLREPASTLVIVYSSAWPEIQEQVHRYGLLALPASAVFADATARARLARAEQLAGQAPVDRMPRSPNAVVVQGPIVPGVTARVLRSMRALHPDHRIVLSTWVDTSAALLADVVDLADDLVLSDRPANPGIQNRNCQIVSTRAGVGTACAYGARWILKTRTDLAVLNASVFESAATLLGTLDDAPARRLGSRGRLLVPSTYTRKFLLYHPSDLVMLGQSDDMQRFWSAPLDPRSGPLFGPERQHRSLAAVSLDGDPSECYLGMSFCRTLGRPIGGTVRDSWAFYRDLFAVVDDDWFEMVWFKNLSTPDAALREGPRQLVSHTFWQRLFNGDAGVQRDLLEIDPASVSFGALGGVAA